MMNTLVHDSDALKAGATGVADSAAELPKTKDDLATEFKTLIAEGEELIKQTSNLSSDALAVAGNRFREQLSAVKSRASDVGALARDKGRDAAVMADNYVRAEPWTSIGVAAGIGLVVGALLFRRP
jgi:ElaB/YqjD/DUF883 family membrane-anchored ribosome-binding protein